MGREADVVEILATRERTKGAFGIFRIEIAPQSGPPAHIHRGEDEFFYVLKGQFQFKLGEQLGDAPAGALQHRRAAGKWRGSTWCPLAAKTTAAREKTASTQTRSSSVRTDVNDLLARFAPLTTFLL
jgi:Cupin domain